MRFRVWSLVPEGEYLVRCQRVDVKDTRRQGLRGFAHFEIADGPQKGKKVLGVFPLSDDDGQPYEVLSLETRAAQAIRAALGRLPEPDEDLDLSILEGKVFQAEVVTVKSGDYSRVERLIARVDTPQAGAKVAQLGGYSAEDARILREGQARLEEKRRRLG